MKQKRSPRQQAVHEATSWAAGLSSDRARLIERKKEYRRKMRELNDASGGDRHALAEEKRIARARYFAVLDRIRTIDGTGPGTRVKGEPKAKPAPKVKAPKAAAEATAKPKRAPAYSITFTEKSGNRINGRGAASATKARDIVVEAMLANADILVAEVVSKTSSETYERDAVLAEAIA